MNFDNVINKKTQHLSSTEYTLNIDFSLPDGFEFDKSGHTNKLYVSSGGPDQGPDKQNQIIREHPAFPVGVPIRSKEGHVELYVDFKFRYYHESSPDDTKTVSFRYVIPIEFDGDGSDVVNLKETMAIN